MTYMVRESAGQIRSRQDQTREGKRGGNCQLGSRPQTPLALRRHDNLLYTSRHSRELWLVNRLPVPGNNHPVTRATTLIQWQKLFQAPEPKPSSQITKQPSNKNQKPKSLSLPFLWPLLCYPYSLLLLSSKIEVPSVNTEKDDPLLFGNALLSGCAAVPHTPRSPTALEASKADNP